MKKNDPKKIFIGYSFYGEHRREVQQDQKYQNMILSVFGKKNVCFGDSTFFTDYSNFFKSIQKLIEGAKYCVFDLMEHNKAKKSLLNLNVILESGVAIGKGKRWYVLIPSERKYTEIGREISNYNAAHIAHYKKGKLKNELKKINDNICEWEKARKTKRTKHKKENKK